jgi:DNA (cytosine-5)-methyltransferase 1
VGGVRPRILDLFSGAGGCAVGYHRAGFDVVGMDHVDQPRYPFEFWQTDAIEFLGRLVAGGSPGGWVLADFDAIHASPPCQAHTALRVMPNAREHADLVAPTRELLMATGLPYVIENVPGAPLRNPVTICGAAFGLGTDAGHDLARHRLFETNFPVMVPPCAHGGRRVLGIYGDHARHDRRARRIGTGQFGAADSLRLGSEAMGIDWMIWRELSQAIPPAYTEHIGSYLMAALSFEQAA